MWADQIPDEKNGEFYGKEPRSMIYFNMNSCRIL